MKTVAEIQDSDCKDPYRHTYVARHGLARTHVCGFLRWYKSLKKGIKFTPLFNISSYSACRALPCLSTRRQSKQLWAHVKLGTLGFDYLYPLYDAFVGFLRSSSGKCVVSELNFIAGFYFLFLAGVSTEIRLFGWLLSSVLISTKCIAYLLIWCPYYATLLRSNLSQVVVGQTWGR